MARLAAFDPSQPLVSRTFIRLHATIYRKGEAVPYADADHRVLKRLYELRRIGYGDGTPVRERIPRQELMAGNAQRSEQDRAAARAAKQTADEAALQSEVAAASDEDEAVAKLAKAHTQKQLVEMANGLEGVTPKQAKADIARALVRAGRA